MEKINDFESWLAEYFCEHNPEVLDDSLPDAVSEWLSDIGPDELIELAEKWHIAQKDKEIRELVEAMEVIKTNGEQASWNICSDSRGIALNIIESALNKHKTINE